MSSDGPDVDALTLEPPAAARGAAAFGERYHLSDTVLGEGGSGRVVLAVDTWLKREVAIKLLRDPHADTSRFLREAQLTATLEHPGVVPVHEVGYCADGTPFYTMRVVRGRTLASRLEGAEASARLALLPALLSVCQTVGWVHKRGVVHRDLKPSNIMIGDAGDAVVLDWGLAGASPDAQGALYGTPGYMSPEQARGEPVTACADVWALGAILYELLAGQPLLTGPREARLDRARRGEYPAPGSGPPELRAIAARALSPEPEQRHPDASALAAEIAAWLTGGRVVSYPYTLREHLRRLAQRHRVAAQLGAALCALLIAVALAGLFGVLRERDRAQRAESQRNQELRATLEKDARRALSELAHVEAEVLAARALGLGEDPEVRGVLIAADSGWLPDRLISEEVPGLCRDIAFGENGSFVAACDEGLWWSEGGPGRFIPTGEPKAEIQTVARVGEVVFAGDPSGRLWRLDRSTLRVVQNASGDWIQVRETSKGQAALTLPYSIFPLDASGANGARLTLPVGQDTPAVWSPDGARLAVSGYGALGVFAWPSGEPTATFQVEHADLRYLAWGRGEDLFSGGDQLGGQQAVWRWRASGGAPTAVLPVDGEVRGLAVSPDGRWLAVVIDGERLPIYDTERLRLVTRLPAKHARMAKFSADGRWLVVAGAGHIDRWALPEALRGERLVPGEDPVATANLVGDAVVAVDTAARISWFDAATGQLERSFDLGFKLHAGNALVERSGRVLAGNAGGHLGIYDYAGLRFLDLGGRISQIVPLAEGWLLGAGDAVEALGNEPRRCPIAQPGAWVEGALAPSADRWLATAGDHLTVLDADTCEILVETGPLSGTLGGLSLSPDGSRVLGGTPDGVIHLWSWPALQALRTLPTHERRPYQFAWTDDGRLFASVSEDGGVALHRADGGLIAAWQAHDLAAWSAAFDPNTQLLVTASSDRTVGLWRLRLLRRAASAVAAEVSARYLPILTGLGLSDQTGDADGQR